MADKVNKTSVNKTTNTNNESNNLFSGILNDNNVDVNTFGAQGIDVPVLSTLIGGDKE